MTRSTTTARREPTDWRRRPHRQHYRHWRSTYQTPSQLQDHQRQHSSRHLHTSRNQLRHSFPRDSTCQETENEVAKVYDQTADTVFPPQYSEQISSTREIRPPGRPRHHYKVIIKATTLPREDDELNIDLPVFFVYHKENKHWLQIKGPTRKFYDDPWYTNIEMLMGATGV